MLAKLKDKYIHDMYLFQHNNALVHDQNIGILTFYVHTHGFNVIYEHTVLTFYFDVSGCCQGEDLVQFLTKTHQAAYKHMAVTSSTSTDTYYNGG